MARRAFRISGETIPRLVALPGDLWDRLAQVVQQKASQLAERARTAAPVRSGKLRDSIKVRMYETAVGPGASIQAGTVNHIARFWELGFGGKAVRVPAHQRRVRGKDQRAKANGRNRIVSKGATEVRAHQMSQPRQHRPYLKPALEAMRQEIRSAMQAAIRRS